MPSGHNVTFADDEYNSVATFNEANGDEIIMQTFVPSGSSRPPSTASTIDRFSKGKAKELDSQSIRSTNTRAERKWESLFNVLKPILTRSSKNDQDSIKYHRRATFDASFMAKLRSSNYSDSPGNTSNNNFYTEHPNDSDHVLLQELPPGASTMSSPSKVSFGSQSDITHASPNGHQKRRSSFELPRKPHFGLMNQDHRTSTTKARLRDAVDRVKFLRLPKNLLRKKPAEDSQKHGLSVFSSAISVPYMAFATDEQGRKHAPVLLEFINLSVAESELAQGESTESVFTINLVYGKMKWTIKRSIVDILRLHSSLTFRHVQHKLENVPKFPSQIHYAISKAKMFALPKQKDLLSRSFLLARLIARRRKSIENYLKEVLKVSRGRMFQELFVFFELGTIITDGWKGKEGYLKKKSYTRTGSCGTSYFKRPGKKVWFAIRDSYIAYFDNLYDTSPQEVLLFDNKSICEPLRHSIKGPIKRHRFQIGNQIRSVALRAESERQKEDFVRDAKDAITTSPWCQSHRHSSFAPIRTGIDVKYYIDGQDYFADVYEAISKAKDTVYIEDWWLSPEIYLRRPPRLYPESRIDLLLNKKASEGVNIYVILYKEVSYALTIESSHTKSVLNSLHKFIKVIRYPDHAPGGILYWALHDKICVVDEKIAFCGGLDLCMGRFDTSEHRLTDEPSGSLNEIWPGMDYSNPRIADFRNVQDYHRELIDRSSTARMPWHDLHCRLKGTISRDISRHFIQRWNFIKRMKLKEREDIPYLLPPPEPKSHVMEGSCNVQVLRSASYWSMGVAREQSIYEAYIYHISNAQHFIYIENQFFVTATEGTSSNNNHAVRNKIGQALCDRIIRAHNEGKKFRVFVVLPLLPAFENEVNDTDGATVRLIVYWHQMSISKGEFSIVQVLKDAGITDPHEYICFCSLRTHDKLESNEEYVTEQIYIHSKVMIVDDRVVIIGSANINDRSMMGNRDSEIAVVIEDQEYIPSLMDNFEFPVARFAHEFRVNLFKEHLGTAASDPEILQDVVSDKFYRNIWMATADINTAIYREVFRCIPDDTVHSWDDYQNFTEIPFKQATGHVGTNAPIYLYEPMLNRVKGNLVFYPTNFLSCENLSIIFPAREYLVSMDVFV